MTPLKKVREELQISEPTGVDWFNFIRDVCAEYFNQNPVEIGGPGIHVEIDESKFGRRKYNRGRWQEGHWVFGGIERITGKSFLAVSKGWIVWLEDDTAIIVGRTLEALITLARIVAPHSVKSSTTD